MDWRSPSADLSLRYCIKRRSFFSFDIVFFFRPVWTSASVVTDVERVRAREVWEGGEGRVRGQREIEEGYGEDEQ